MLLSVNHRFPSDPAVMPLGPAIALALTLGMMYCVIAPDVVTFMIRSARDSVAQSFPSGPTAMSFGARYGAQSSAELMGLMALPPTTRTAPLTRTVSVIRTRPVRRSLVLDHVCANESKTWAVGPPTTRTVPL